MKISQLLVIAMLALPVIGYSQYPKIGAQVFIEPGQSSEQIENWFKILEENHFELCRIRLFESHIHQGDKWDFSLYDQAFEAAKKHNIKVFVTLFPADKDRNLGGFKLPSSEEHLDRISQYIQKVVGHYKDHPTLSQWVLINEPAGGVDKTSEYYQSRFKAWKDSIPVEKTAGYWKQSYDDQWFIRDFYTWYLQWLADEVRKQDVNTPLHVNPHMIFHLLPAYDFPAWRGFLSSLGASMHPSWHFADFPREEYAMALAANCEIIASGAGEMPWYVTELQGGPNISSGFNPMTPSPEEFEQWIWQSVFTGAKGIIFWTLNPRGTGFEAGEWALLDFQDQPTPRMKAAANIARVLKENKDLFANFNQKGQQSHISLIYNPESIIIQGDRHFEAPFIREQYEGRKPTANIYSVVGWHKALMTLGADLDYQLMEDFPWRSARNQVAIIPNMISIPEKFQEPIHQFVENGNTLVMSGLSGMYDEYNHNVMNTQQPFKELFGAEAKEYGFEAKEFELEVLGEKVKAHMVKGLIKNNDAVVIGKAGEAVTAIQNKAKKGQVYWMPSLLGLSAKDDPSSLTALIKKMNIVNDNICQTTDKDVLITPFNQNTMLLLINKGNEPASIALNASKVQKVLYGKSMKTAGNMTLAPGETRVLMIKDK